MTPKILTPTLLGLFALAALVCGSTFAQAPRTQDADVAALKRDAGPRA